MSDKPDFRELVGEDLPREEEERLRHVHDLLVAAGPPPELPPHLQEPVDPDQKRDNVSYLPRRRAGLMLGIAAAIALVAFLGGFVSGRANGPAFDTKATVPMHGTAAAPHGTATIDLAAADSSGNWPLKVVVHGLTPLPKGQFYEMFLTKDGKPVATCGTFRLNNGDSVLLNAPYPLRDYDGWIVTREKPGAATHPVVLRTNRI